MNLKYEGIFIVGTDTGVGKTYVSCAIAELLKKSGAKIGVLKPFASGDRTDASALLSASGCEEKMDIVNPLFFEYPLAPTCSALLEKRKINIQKVYDSLGLLKKKYPFVIIEGIGGVLVPVANKTTFADLMKKINFPAVIVARSGLGTINHTLLTYEALKKRGVKILGVIYNNYRGDTHDERLSCKEIYRITGLPILAKIGVNNKLKSKDIKWLFN